MRAVMARTPTEIDPEVRRRSLKPRLLFGVLNLALFALSVWAVYGYAPATADKALFLKISGGAVILGMWVTHNSMAPAFAKAPGPLLAVLVVAWGALAGWFIAGV